MAQILARKWQEASPCRTKVVPHGSVPPILAAMHSPGVQEVEETGYTHGTASGRSEIV